MYKHLGLYMAQQGLSVKNQTEQSTNNKRGEDLKTHSTLN